MVKRTYRQINGIVLLDKPTGLTSNTALQKVKHLYGARKAGHTGSLDPLASGMLPICLGEATKISGFLLASDKTYDFSCRLGMTTTTGDAEGEVMSTRPIDILSRSVVEAVLKRFIGDIQQRPPMYSALKHKGQPLYRLARRGIVVERQQRRVTIHELQLLQLRDDYLVCRVRCSKGTYVRTLAEDIGELLGCGAHIAELRRLLVQPYQASQMVSLEQLQEKAKEGTLALDAMLLSPDTAIVAWPAVHLADAAAYRLRQGQSVRVAQLSPQDQVRLYDQEGGFMGVGKILNDGRVAVSRLLQH